MIFTFLPLILIPFLGLIAWSDFRSRNIPVWVLIIIFILISIVSIFKNGLNQSFSFLLYNLSFLSLQFLLLTIYFSIKNHKIHFIPDSLIGWGDIVFLGLLTVAFSPVNYIVFLSLGYIFTLILTLILKLFNLTKNTWQQIPLAGVISLLYSILLLASLLIKSISPWNDGWIFVHFY